VELLPTAELIALLRRQLPQEGRRVDHADVLMSRTKTLS